MPINPKRTKGNNAYPKEGLQAKPSLTTKQLKTKRARMLAVTNEL